MNVNLKYDQQIYINRPLSVKEFTNNNYDIIHQQLFNNANKMAYNDLMKDILSYENIDCPFSDNNKLAIKRYKNFQKIKDSIDTYEKFIANVNIIESKDQNYYMPSSVIWRLKAFPFFTLSIKKQYIPNSPEYWFINSPGQMSLEYWWNSHIKNKVESITANDKYNNYEIIYINYVSGYVIMENRVTDKKIKVLFSEINENSKISEDYSLENTFMHKINY